MLTDRGLKILLILLESNHPIGITELAGTFSLSERSIRYDIQNINDTLESNSLPIVHKKGKGSFEVVSKSEVKKYVDSLGFVHYSNDARRNFIMHSIALNCRINMSSMSKALNISRSTIKKDVELLKELLQDYKLRLVHSDRTGLTLNGTERNIRHLQCDSLIANFIATNHGNLLIQPVIDQYLNPINLKLIDNYISIVEQNMRTILSEESYLKFKAHVIISIKRIINGHFLTNDTNTEKLITFPEYKSIGSSLHLLEIAYDIHYVQSEIAELMYHFIGSSPYSFPSEPYINWFEVETYITELINRFSTLYNLDLTRDNELKKDMIIILKPIWFKNKKSNTEHKLKLKHIADSHMNIYNHVTQALSGIPQTVLLELDSHSILNMTLTFITAIERNSYKLNTVKNIIIICAHGYGSSKLLELQLKQKFNVNIIHTLPLHQLKRFKDYDIIDTIITTTPINNTNLHKNIILVNPILNEKDINMLRQKGLKELNQSIMMSEIIEMLNPYMDYDVKKTMSNMFKERLGDLIIDDIWESKKNLLALLSLKNISTNVHVDTWEDAIYLAGNLLLENHCVDKTYVETLVEAFKLYGAYMIIKDNIAIPHAKNEGNIIRTGMSLIILDESVMTPFNKPIQIILAFSSYDETQHLDSLYEFSNLIQNEGFLTQLLSLKTSKQVHNLISKMSTGTEDSTIT